MVMFLTAGEQPILPPRCNGLAGMQRERSEMPEAAGVFSTLRCTQGTGSIFNYIQLVLSCDGQNTLHYRRTGQTHEPGRSLLSCGVIFASI